MRCIKCLNNSRKFRVIFGLCSLLLSVCFCLSGLLSQSVSATEITTTEVVYPVLDFDVEGKYGLSVTKTTPGPYVFTSQTSGSSGVSSTFLHPQIRIADSASEGLYFSFYMDIYIFTQENGEPVITCPNSPVGAKYVIDSCDYVSGGSYNYSYQSSGTWNEANPGSGFVIQNGLYFDSSSVITHYILIFNGHVASSNYTSMVNLRGPFLRVNDGLFVASFSLSNFRFFSVESLESEAINNQTQQQQDYHDETQQTFDDAQDTADTDSDSSSSQASASGTTLLAGFTSFLGALTNATPSNCVIDGNIGDFRMGNIDLCQLDPPPAFQAISSIMVIGFTVPLSIALGRKMISLFRSFQG